MLRWAGKEREFGSEDVSSWWLCTCRTVMVAGRVSLTLYALCMMSQSGWRHCWMEKGVSWERLTTPRLSLCRFDVMWGEFGKGGKVVRMALRAYRAPR
jgi:hypothetical protein